MIYEYAKLKFISPLHLSKGKLGLDVSFEILHSDTLKSAIFTSAIELYGESAVLAGGDGKAFFESFTISSAFPYVNEDLFFPKPEWLPNSFDEAIRTKSIDRKTVKKIRYFSQKYYQNLLNGNLILDKDKVDKYYAETKLIENQPFKSETVQRVSVSRTFEEDGKTFYTERLFFTEGCGLFFLIQLHDESKREMIQSALRLMGDNGIGSDKSAGNGQFEFDCFEKLNLELPKEAAFQTNLSLYCPDYEAVKDEDFLNKSAYSLTKRGGYLANPRDFNHSTLRKKSILMFTEGSVFPKNRVLTGKIVDLAPENENIGHAVWRDGRALFLPYHLNV
jgi:CRISPR-associated protein Csm4